MAALKRMEICPTRRFTRLQTKGNKNLCYWTNKKITYEKALALSNKHLNQKTGLYNSWRTRNWKDCYCY